MDNQQFEQININQSSSPIDPTKKGGVKFGLSIAVLIICLVAAGVAVYWIKTEPTEQSLINIVPKKSTTTSTSTPEGASNATSSINFQNPNQPDCHDSPKHFVILQLNETYSALNLLVKYKTSNNQKISCSYNVEKTDFELKDLDTDGYFLALTDNFLILDFGTAPPPRLLKVYDLNSRKEVYKDSYDSYASPVTTSGDSITYWNPTDENVTSKNCPQLNEYSADGLGAVIEAHVTLNLSNLTKKELGEYRCEPIQ